MTDDSPEGREATRQNVTRWFRFRWLQPVFNILITIGFIILAITSPGGNNKQQLTQLQVSVAVLQAFDQTQVQTNRESAAVFNAFFTEFIAEQNYLCRIASARALADHLEPPPPGICNVTLGSSPNP